MGEAIESSVNSRAESKLGFKRWYSCQSLETPITRLAVKQRNLCITFARNVRVGQGYIAIQIFENSVCLFVFGRIYKKITELWLKGVGNQSRIGYWLLKAGLKKSLG